MSYSILNTCELPRNGNAHKFEGYLHGDTTICMILVDIPVGGGPRLHRHPYEEIFVIQEGRATFTVPEESTCVPAHGRPFLATSLELVKQARVAPGCRDLVVAADPIDPDRVNVYEEWESEAALLAFRGDGPGDDLSSVIVSADVQRHVISSSGPT